MYYNARFYDPSIGRFLTADTIVPDPTNAQSFNRYAYVHNNPIKYTDPTGHGLDDPYGNEGAGNGGNVGTTEGKEDRGNDGENRGPAAPSIAGPKPTQPHISPTYGPITSLYGLRFAPWNGVISFHAGLDFGASGGYGSPCIATADGTVVGTRTDSVKGSTKPNSVTTDHGDGTGSSQAHCDPTGYVERGDTVTQGQQTGEIDNSGFTTGAHSHFQGYDTTGEGGWVNIDPTDWFNTF